MKLSTRSRYGTRALVDIARNSENKPVLLRDVAQRQDISQLYLERLISPLTGAGILRTTRGAHGGVSLARPASEIKISEVIQLLEGSIVPVECASNPGLCPRSAECAARDLWEELSRAMDSVLENVTVQDLVVRQEQKELASGAGS